MPTQYLNLIGTARWTKNHTPDPMYDNYSIDLCPDEKSLAQVKASGIQVSPKMDSEGEWYKFRRPVSKQIKDELVKFGPPKTIDAKGNDFTEVIGNGSKVEATVVVYDTRKGKGHRLERIKVLEHVPYVRADPQQATELPPNGATVTTSKTYQLMKPRNEIPF